MPTTRVSAIIRILAVIIEFLFKKPEVLEAGLIAALDKWEAAIVASENQWDDLLLPAIRSLRTMLQG